MKAAENVLRQRRGLDVGAVRPVAHALHRVQARRRRVRRRPDGTARGHEHAALLGDVHGRAEARRGGRADQAPGRQRTVGRDRRADGRADADVEGSAGRVFLRDPAGASRQSTGCAPEVGRGVVDRADDDGRAGGDDVLRAGVRLAAERRNGHGRRWQVPDVQPRQPDDRRHDEQARRDGAGPAVLGDLLPGARHQGAAERITANGGT